MAGSGASCPAAINDGDSEFEFHRPGRSGEHLHQRDAEGPALPSVVYYERNAEAFFAETIGVDMRPLYQPFLARLPPSARILDAGCGAGRDLRAFRDLGYQPTGFDASPTLARLAAAHADTLVYCMDFRAIPWHDRFHGVWACASLLHVTRSALPLVLARLARALVFDGILYASFKHGHAEREKDGRIFTDMDETRMAVLLDEVAVLAPIDIWITADRLPGRDHERWLNVLLKQRDAAKANGLDALSR